MHISGGDDNAFEHGWGGFGKQGVAVHVYHAGLAEGWVRFHHVFQEFDEELPDGRERVRLGEGRGRRGRREGGRRGRRKGGRRGRREEGRKRQRRQKDG
jgi:hypothetical protein